MAKKKRQKWNSKGSESVANYMNWEPENNAIYF